MDRHKTDKNTTKFRVKKKKLKDNNIFAIPEKSAQKIAKQKLNPIVN